MAKAKAELQSDFDRCKAATSSARSAASAGDVVRAVELAVGALDYVDGMIQYERRYGGRESFESIECVDIVLKYAPVIFDAPSLERVAKVLRTQRRIEKCTSADLASKLTDARSLMQDAHRLWTLIEKESSVRQDTLARVLTGTQDRWRALAEVWGRLGVIQRAATAGTYLLSFSTLFDGITKGKCSSCGELCEAAKSDFLVPRTCSSCQVQGYFILAGPN